MPLRSLAAVKVQYHKARKPDQLSDVAALPDGLDLLDFAHGVINLPQGAFTSEKKLEFCAPLSIERRKRVLLVDFESGHYGEEGRAKNVDSGQLTHSITPRESTPVDTFAAFYVPKSGTAALLFLETAAGSKVRTRVVDLLRRAWRARYPGWTIDTTSLMHGEDWLQKAELESVVATIEGWSGDIGDAAAPKKIGTLAHTILPAFGQKFLPPSLKTSLLNRKLKRGAVLGIPGAQDPDEVKVQMFYNGQSKTYVLGKEKTPPVRIHLSDHGEPRLSDDQFIVQCDDEADRFFKSLQVDWQRPWSEGTSDASNVPKLEVPSEHQDLDDEGSH